MAIKVRKCADIIGNLVVPSGSRQAGDVAAVLTNFEPAHDPILESAWQLELLIGEGSAARRVMIDLPPVLSTETLVNEMASSKGFPPTVVGTFDWQVTYDGDANNRPFTGSLEPETVVAATVPEPSSAFVLLSALASLMGLGWLQRRFS